MIDLYAQLAAAALAAKLHASAPNDPTDLVSGAVISALLEPTNRRTRKSASGLTLGQLYDAGTAADDEATLLADTIITRLFSVALMLDSARSTLESGPARDRISAATSELDNLISEVRAAIVNNGAARRRHE